MKFLGQSIQKLEPKRTDTQTDTHTDRHTDTQTDTTENITLPHTRTVTMFDTQPKSVLKLQRLKLKKEGLSRVRDQTTESSI